MWLNKDRENRFMEYRPFPKKVSPRVYLRREVGGARTIPSNGIPDGFERLAPPRRAGEQPEVFDHAGLLI
jgi:hypothetical protein